MAYKNHFKHADDLVGHLNGFVPGLSDPLLRVKYTGFVAVAAVTVYELAIKEIFCEFGRRKHKVLGSFTESYFERINGRIKIKNIEDDYVARFGKNYVDRFRKNLNGAVATHLATHKRDLRSGYSNLILWRNDFAHEGKAPTTATYPDVVIAYEDGKAVIDCLATSMVR
ncbi:HEPN domain-containing protein [Variovorax sp. J22P240]|uniref:HEPN domain-containing protein n=1 Tax=Variovorax sp. J22P240 TaxID=3053514 RepID=UPI002577385D|nr:HEPN domain-containing protein [Variovorax sp. J22P240]MDM0002706.1 HEPN domain-containing protein [Variovorax sp. J22P240]